MTFTVTITEQMMGDLLFILILLSCTAVCITAIFSRK